MDVHQPYLGPAFSAFRLTARARFVCCHPAFQVVGPTNELVEAKLQLKVETQRILSQMTLKARLVLWETHPCGLFGSLVRKNLSYSGFCSLSLISSDEMC